MKNITFFLGSYGDLLSKGQPIFSKEIVAKEWKSKGTVGVGEKIKCCNEGGDHPKSVCHKIPITSELYLETHTHVRSNKSSATPTATTTPREQEQQQPRKNLKTRGERERGLSGKKVATTVSPNQCCSHKDKERYHEKYHECCGDDGDGPRNKAVVRERDIAEVEMEKFVQLRLENEVLRKQASGDSYIQPMFITKYYGFEANLFIFCRPSR